MQKIQTAIFDMDGLLVDSEPIWKEAEHIIFGKAGIEMTIEMCNQVMGMRVDEAVEHWLIRFPKINFSSAQMQSMIMDKVEELITEKGKIMEGVIPTIELLKSENIKIGLASSSHFRVIYAILKQFQLEKYFEIVHSAELEKYGKPHPAIYLSTAEKLNTHPSYCLAFEDSFNGLISAKAAKMKTICVPDKNHFSETHFDIADKKLKSLSDFKTDYLYFS
ncbi:MAG TPA: hexitol phosphatase HxpB [Bacteroidia bacterium]|nr:hexitol phosphatase HxpB [Bacteroidia bacterium]